MLTLTLYLNNDRRQVKCFTARTTEKLIDKVERYLLEAQPDVCLGFSEDEPLHAFNYDECYKEWEYRPTLDDLYDFGLFVDVLPTFIDQARSKIQEETR